MKTSTQEFNEAAILNFFDRNRDEWLCVADAAIKFGIGKSTATRTLNSLATRGLLKKSVGVVSNQKANVYLRA